MDGVGRGWGKAQRQPHLFEHFNAIFCQSVALSDVSATIQLKTENRPPSCTLVAPFYRNFSSEFTQAVPCLAFLSSVIYPFYDIQHYAYNR